MVILWAIWRARRRAIHENEFQYPLSTHAFLDRLMADISEADTKPLGGSVNTPRLATSSRTVTASWTPVDRSFSLGNSCLFLSFTVLSSCVVCFHAPNILLSRPKHERSHRKRLAPKRPWRLFGAHGWPSMPRCIRTR